MKGSIPFKVREDIGPFDFRIIAVVPKSVISESPRSLLVNMKSDIDELRFLQHRCLNIKVPEQKKFSFLYGRRRV